MIIIIWSDWTPFPGQQSKWNDIGQKTEEGSGFSARNWSGDSRSFERIVQIFHGEHSQKSEKPERRDWEAKLEQSSGVFEQIWKSQGKF